MRSTPKCGLNSMLGILYMDTIDYDIHMEKGGMMVFIVDNCGIMESLK